MVGATPAKGGARVSSATAGLSASARVPNGEKIPPAPEPGRQAVDTRRPCVGPTPPTKAPSGRIVNRRAAGDIQVTSAFPPEIRMRPALTVVAMGALAPEGGWRLLPGPAVASGLPCVRSPLIAGMGKKRGAPP